MSSLNKGVSQPRVVKCCSHNYRSIGSWVRGSTMFCPCKNRFIRLQDISITHSAMLELSEASYSQIKVFPCTSFIILSLGTNCYVTVHAGWIIKDQIVTGFVKRGLIAFLNFQFQLVTTHSVFSLLM